MENGFYFGTMSNCKNIFSVSVSTIWLAFLEATLNKNVFSSKLWLFVSECILSK